MNELDLTIGDPDAAERIQSAGQERSKRVRAASGASSSRSSSSKSSGSRSSKASSQKIEEDLADRIGGALERIAEQREAREDYELAAVLREDKEAITRGLMSLTRSVKPLRTPLVVVLSFLEPVLAFWRIGTLLLGRLYARRNAAAIAQQEAMAEHEAAMAAAA